MDENVNLKRFRQAMNLTQAKAAESIGIDQRQWNRYENGKNEIPVRYLKELCIKHKISADWLLEIKYENEGGETMNIREILYELKNEIHNSVRGSFHQDVDREETENMIHQNIEQDFNNIIARYTEE